MRESRVIFVGVHNKPNKTPLCASTKTGKLIERVIEKLPYVEPVLTNLFDKDAFPEKEEMRGLASDWYWKNLPTDVDVIVLLGAIVHRQFYFKDLNVIKAAHPASKRSHKDMNEYIDRVSKKIRTELKLIEELETIEK